MSLRRLLSNDPFGPVTPDWSARLRQTHRKSHPPPPDTRGIPTIDGAPRKPMIGGGRYQHPLLPIYKTRAPRRYS